ncbi:hypothetical protein HDV02_005997 [Globomyces sp. JEL0801]|nr:hypothetical protein HDV02_005997 [Globomyces sp. JEL0801]
MNWSWISNALLFLIPVMKAAPVDLVPTSTTTETTQTITQISQTPTYTNTQSTGTSTNGSGDGIIVALSVTLLFLIIFLFVLYKFISEQNRKLKRTSIISKRHSILSTEDTKTQKRNSWNPLHTKNEEPLAYLKPKHNADLTFDIGLPSDLPVEETFQYDYNDMDDSYYNTALDSNHNASRYDASFVDSFFYISPSRYGLDTIYEVEEPYEYQPTYHDRLQARLRILNGSHSAEFSVDRNESVNGSERFESYSFSDSKSLKAFHTHENLIDTESLILDKLEAERFDEGISSDVDSNVSNLSHGDENH